MSKAKTHMIKTIANVAFATRENREFTKNSVQNLLVIQLSKDLPECDGSISNEEEFVSQVKATKFSPSIDAIMADIFAANSVEEIEAVISKVRLV